MFGLGGLLGGGGGSISPDLSSSATTGDFAGGNVGFGSSSVGGFGGFAVGGSGKGTSAEGGGGASAGGLPPWAWIAGLGVAALLGIGFLIKN